MTRSRGHFKVGDSKPSGPDPHRNWPSERRSRVLSSHMQHWQVLCAATTRPKQGPRPVLEMGDVRASCDGQRGFGGELRVIRELARPWYCM